MRLRDSIGLNLSPVFLRLVLGIVFTWAGAGKFFAKDHFTPEQTARLAQMGVDIPGTPPADLPVEDEPGVDEAEPDVEDPAGETPATEIPTTEPGAAEPIPAPDASRYPEGAELRRVYGLALGLDAAAHPGFNEDGEQLEPIWPPDAAKGQWAVYVALAAGITELVAGVLVLAGFFTRFAAIALACVMAAAMWLTQFGPAIQQGKTVLGFLPDHPLYDGELWTPLLFQFSLFGAALALLFLGAGAMSIDAIIFGAPGERRRRVPREDDDD